MLHKLFTSFACPTIERNERSDFGCLLKLWGTRVCLANFVNQSGFRKLAANQSQVEGNRGKNVGYLDMQLKSLLSFISMLKTPFSHHVCIAQNELFKVCVS